MIFFFCQLFFINDIKLCFLLRFTFDLSQRHYPEIEIVIALPRPTSHQCIMVWLMSPIQVAIAGHTLQHHPSILSRLDDAPLQVEVILWRTGSHQGHCTWLMATIQPTIRGETFEAVAILAGDDNPLEIWVGCWVSAGHQDVLAVFLSAIEPALAGPTENTHGAVNQRSTHTIQLLLPEIVYPVIMTYHKSLLFFISRPPFPCLSLVPSRQLQTE